MANIRSLLCGITIAGIAIARSIHQLVPYMAGRRGHDQANQQNEFSWIILLGFCIVISIFSAIALCTVLVRRILIDYSPGRKAYMEAIVFFVLIATTLFLCISSVQNSSHYFLNGFKTFIEDQSTLPEILHWSRGLSCSDGMISQKYWPKVVMEIFPSFVSVETFNGNCEVSLIWGGGFMHWGLTLHNKHLLIHSSSIKRIQIIDDCSYVWVDSR